jgi:hypothetical protein
MQSTFRAASLACGIVLALASHAAPPEQLRLTHCYSGSGAGFHNSQDAMQLSTWNQNGIISSDGPGKRLDSAVVRCEGVEHGVGQTRVGYGLCKIVDKDGDVIVGEIPYTGFSYDVKFLSGSGKWKGITGGLHSERLVRSDPGKGAMPGTYQGCRREEGSFQLPG